MCLAKIWTGHFPPKWVSSKFSCLIAAHATRVHVNVFWGQWVSSKFSCLIAAHATRVHVNVFWGQWGCVYLILLTVWVNCWTVLALLGKKFYNTGPYMYICVQTFYWCPKNLVQDCILWLPLLVITTSTNAKLKVLVLLRGRVQQPDWSQLGTSPW